MDKVRGLIIDTSGRVLLGFDPKYQKYNLVGGHCEPGEYVLDGLLREVKEECNLEVFEKMEYLFNYDDNEVFLLMVDRSKLHFPHTYNDPDKEFSKLGWFFMMSLPSDIYEKAEEIIYKFLRLSRGKEDGLQFTC